MINLTGLTLSFTLLVLTSCSTKSKTEEANASHTAEASSASEKDVTQLTFRDVLDLVFDDEGEGIEWHGEEMSNELTDLLSITEGIPCGRNECGTRLTLTSAADKTMTVVIKGDYNIKGDMGYIARKYTIAAGASLDIGCSHLCYGGEAFEFTRAIVGSNYEVK